MQAVMPLADPQFTSLLENVERAATMAELHTSLETVLGLYGLKHVVYHALLLPQAAISQMALVHTYPAEWISHYAASRYYLIDPVVLTAQSGILPFDWDRLDKTPKRVRRLFQEADDVGVGRHGITIPVRGAYGERALFTVTSDCTAHEWETKRLLYLRDMQMIAVYAHNRVLAINDIAPIDSSFKLSRRERECLVWAAAGKTVEDTSHILSLSASAVKLYLDSARSKLNCLTKTQTVARALSLGLISI